MEILTCGALGGPDNAFEWRKIGSDFPVGVTAEINITITSAFSGGEYECYVSNDAGNDRIITIVNGESIKNKILHSHTILYLPLNFYGSGSKDHQCI